VYIIQHILIHYKIENTIKTIENTVKLKILIIDLNLFDLTI